MGLVGTIIIVLVFGLAVVTSEDLNDDDKAENRKD